MNGIWVIEFNAASDNVLDPYSWHIDVLHRSVKSNLENLLRRKNPGKWVIVAFAESREKAKEMSFLIKKQLLEESEKRPHCKENEHPVRYKEQGEDWGKPISFYVDKFIENLRSMYGNPEV